MKKSQSKTKSIHHNRLSIEVKPEMHRLIKINAALHNQSIRDYVLRAITKYIQQEMESKTMSMMVREISPSLKELWNNSKDAAYDNL